MSIENMHPDRRAYVETHVMIAEDFADGAFMGYLMEEKGIDPEEIAAVCNDLYGTSEESD